MEPELVLTAPLRLPDRLRGLVAECLELRALVDEAPSLRVARRDPLDELGATLLREGALDLLRSLADQPDVQHCSLLSSPRTLLSSRLAPSPLTSHSHTLMPAAVRPCLGSNHNLLPAARAAQTKEAARRRPLVPRRGRAMTRA